VENDTFFYFSQDPSIFFTGRSDMNDQSNPSITVFHCINIFAEGDALPLTGKARFNARFVKLPCSSMVKDVFLLRAFEAGADAVVVMVCPEGVCRYVEGNIRAAKRVGWVRKILDEIGLGGQRLSIFNIAAGDTGAVDAAIEKARAVIKTMGPNPAA
jgi:F420-non-reducing hydrogenase iron-sulfur subunit